MRQISKTLFAVACFVLLVGCARHPQIDLSDSIRTPLQRDPASPVIASLTIVNRADDGKMKYGGLSSDYMPIQPAVTTKETVEGDIKRYVQERVFISNKGTKSLRVVIHTAKSYVMGNAGAKIPIFGLFFLGVDGEYGLELKVSFEIIKDGKAVNTYWYDDVITIMSKTITASYVDESYQKLIAKYRQEFFDILETEFIGRYL